MQDASDEALARSARAGDDDALRTLCERYEAMLRRRAGSTLRGALRGRVAASDVIQETWLTTFLRLDGFEDRGPGSFRAWLTRILRNKVNDQVRNHVRAARRSVLREVREEATPSGERAPAATSSPSQHAARVDDCARALDTLRLLPPDHREVLRLVHLEGLTYVQAGERLGRSANATLKLYGRALARLAELLADGEKPS